LEAGFRTKRRRYKDAKSFSDPAELEKDLAPQSRENKAARGGRVARDFLDAFKATLKSL
jgi:hypothetical protein